MLVTSQGNVSLPSNDGRRGGNSFFLSHFLFPDYLGLFLKRKSPAVNKYLYIIYKYICYICTYIWPLRRSFCHTVRAGSAKKTGNLLMGCLLGLPLKPPLPAISATRVWDSNRRFTLACVVVMAGEYLEWFLFSFLFTQYHDIDFKNKVHFLSSPSQLSTETRKINTTSEVDCPGRLVCSLSKQPPRDASGSEQVPMDSREPRMDTAFLGFLACPQQARGGGVACRTGRSHRVLAELCQGFCLESWRLFCFCTEDFCAKFLGWSSFSWPHPISCRQGTYSLKPYRSWWRKKKRGFLLQAQSLPQACENVEVAVGANPSWWALSPFKIFHGYWFC